MRTRTLHLLAALAFLPGCSSWPDAGRGGQAEDRPTAINAEQPITPEVFDLQMASDVLHTRLQLLALKGGTTCLPARLDRENRHLNRLKREIAGGLYEDAVLDARLIHFNLETLENQLDYLISRTDCEITDSSLYGQAGPQSLQIFFASDSSELGDGYHPVLSHFARHVLALPGARIEIIGYTDPQGESDHNRQLARARAEAVRMALLETRPELETLIVTRAAGEGQDLALPHNTFALGLGRRALLMVHTRPAETRSTLPVSQWDDTLSADYQNRNWSKQP